MSNKRKGKKPHPIWNISSAILVNSFVAVGDQTVPTLTVHLIQVITSFVPLCHYSNLLLHRCSPTNSKRCREGRGSGSVAILFQHPQRPPLSYLFFCSFSSWLRFQSLHNFSAHHTHHRLHQHRWPSLSRINQAEQSCHNQSAWTTNHHDLHFQSPSAQMRLHRAHPLHLHL